MNTEIQGQYHLILKGLLMHQLKISFSSCCQSDITRFASTNPLTQCFEMNGCYGLQWTVHHGCLEETIMNIGKKLMLR